MLTDTRTHGHDRSLSCFDATNKAENQLVVAHGCKVHHVLKSNNLLQICDVYPKMHKPGDSGIRAFWCTRQKSEANYLILIRT